MQSNNKTFLNILIATFSVVLVTFLVWYIYFKPESSHNYTWVGYLPYVNAILNSISAIFLSIAIIAIKNGNAKIHIRMIACASVASLFFLVSYLLYHHFHGDTKFLGVGFIRPVYFFILISHIILSVFLVPLYLLTVINALVGNFISHRKWARITFPVWMYVSVTGVLIVVILKTY